MARTRTPKKVCTVIGLAMAAMMLVWLGGVLLGQALVGRAAPQLMNRGWVTWLINDIPLYFMAVPVFLLVLGLVPSGPLYARPRHRVGPARWLLALLFCFGAAYAINFVTNLFILVLQLLFGNLDTYSNSLAEMAATGGLLTNLFFGAVVPALGEEFLFRHTLRRKLRGCADSTYILMSGLCFALFHANVQQIPYAFAIGALFAWLYLVTGNIWLPVSLHFVINLFGLIIMPALALDTRTMGLVSGFVLVAMAGAVSVFFVWRRRAAATLLPPTEPGWPYNPPGRPAAAYPVPHPARPALAPPAGGPPVYVPPAQRAAQAALPPWHLRYTPPRQRTSFTPPTFPAAPPVFAMPAPAAMPPQPRYPGSGPAPWPHPPPRPAHYPVMPPRPPRQRTLGFCLANPGMVAYMVVAGAATALSFMALFI